MLELALAAKAELTGPEWMQGLSVADLSEEDQAAIDKVPVLGPKVCGKCRWTSGCLACDRDKAIRYYLRLRQEQLTAERFQAVCG